ncbi:MAG: discoidin domain-containing protein [Acutalibacteraceae bacterium]|jgi:hypothetical protein
MKPVFRVKRWTAILLAAAMLASAAPFAAAQEESALLTALPGISAAATFTQDLLDPYEAIDGDASTRWSSYGGGQSLPQALQIDLGSEYAVDRVESDWYKDDRTYTYDLILSKEPAVVDGAFALPTGAYRQAGLTGTGSGEITGSGRGTVVRAGSLASTVTLPRPVNARYVTVLCTAASAGTSAAIWEVRAYGG